MGTDALFAPEVDGVSYYVTTLFEEALSGPHATRAAALAAMPSPTGYLVRTSAYLFGSGDPSEVRGSVLG